MPPGRHRRAGVDLINAGKTSAVAGYIDAATNTVTGANVFLETFDALATGNNSFGFPTRPTDSNLAKIQFGGPNGGFNSLNPNTPANGGDLTITNPGGLGMGIQKGTTRFCSRARRRLRSKAPAMLQDATRHILPTVQAKAAQCHPASRVRFCQSLGRLTAPVTGLTIWVSSTDQLTPITKCRFYDDLGNLISGIGDLSDGILSGTEILGALVIFRQPNPQFERLRQSRVPAR